MNASLRNRVESYLDNYLPGRSSLVFVKMGENESIPIDSESVVTREHFSGDDGSIESIVYNTINLSKSYNSYRVHKHRLTYQCRNGAFRSSIDLWRHIKYYFPEVTIYDVMHALYRLRFKINGLFCTIVKRFVVYNLVPGWRIRDEIVTEFGFSFSYFEDI